MNTELIARLRGRSAMNSCRYCAEAAEALAAADQQAEALSRELLTPQVFTRLVEWLRDPKPATAAFTAGIERQIAYALEIDVLPEVKSLRIRLKNEKAETEKLRSAIRQTLADGENNGERK